VDATA
jgi:hypothetical protein